MTTFVSKMAQEIADLREYYPNTFERYVSSYTTYQPTYNKDVKKVIGSKTMHASHRNMPFKKIVEDKKLTRKTCCYDYECKCNEKESEEMFQ